MRRALVVLMVAMLAVLLLATPGLAGNGTVGPGHGRPALFVLQGCISQTDTAAKTFEVDVVKSMYSVVLPDPATILTNEKTRFIEYVEGAQVPITFLDLAAYDPVSVRGQVTASGLLATQVTVNPDCPVLEGMCVAPGP